jgi:tetratricopeptide (TPR) repeat protein
MTRRRTWPLGEKPPWLVRIRGAEDEDPHGAGMLCPDGHIVTCAHVVGDTPDSPVYVEFQHAPPHEPIRATVVPGGWHPRHNEDLADVAVLELHGPPPEEAAPAPLRSTASGVQDHTFRAYGYPTHHRQTGTPAEGRIVGHARTEWIKLEARSDLGQALVRGFSGTPVWDVQTGGVVGIAVTKDVDSTASRTGYAIPCEVLARYWPPLDDFVDADPTPDDVANAEALARLLDLELTDDLELPRIVDTDIYELGVKKSKWWTEDNPNQPYVPRPALDAELADALAHRTFVLAKGDSTSGKSRALLEALRVAMPEARLIKPKDAAALPALAELALPVERGAAVLWLDDLDLFLRPNGLDRHLLKRFARLGILVAGTISTIPYAAVRKSTDSTNRAARTVLQEACRVTVPPKLTSAEQVTAGELYQGEDFHELGIGAQAVAAPALKDWYDTSRVAEPSAWAVLHAVIDWRRIGITTPMPEQTLRAMFPHYLALATTVVDASDELFAEGLECAREPVAGTVAPLSATGTPGERVLRAFDYVVALADGQDGLEPRPVPDFLLTHAIETRHGEDLLYIAFAALGRGLGAPAMAACRRARDTAEDLPLRARATLMLGELEAVAGNTAAALDMLEEALDSDVPDVVPLARAELGGLLVNTGRDLDRARELLQTTLDSGDRELRPFAQLNLGVLLMNSGDHKAARPLLEKALAAGDPEVDSQQQARFTKLITGQEEAERNRAPRAAPDSLSPRAMPGPAADQPGLDVAQLLRTTLVGDRSTVTPFAQASLGGLLVNEGDLDGGKVLLETALRSGNTAVLPLAQVNLAGLLLQKGDVEGAAGLYEDAAKSGNPMVTSIARVGLGWILADGTDPDRGRALLSEVALDSSDAQAARAACLLGDVGAQYGAADAAHWYETALRYDHPEWTPHAQTGLGIVASARGDAALALQYLRPVAASGHPERAPRAAVLMGDVLAADLDSAGAEEAYRAAVDSGHTMWAPIATLNLARLMFRDDRTAEALRLVEDTANEDGPYAPWAFGALGDLLCELGDRAGAERAYRRAVDSDHPTAAQSAQCQLAMLLADEDQPTARRLLESAAEGPEPMLAAQATTTLGEILTQANEPEAAKAAYQKAIDRGHPVYAAFARYELALVHLAAEDTSSAEQLLREATRATASEVPAIAHLLLGVIRLMEEDQEGGEEEFAKAAEFVAPRVIHDARLQAARSAFEDGRQALASRLVQGLTDNVEVEPAVAEAARAYTEAESTPLALVRHAEYLFDRDDLAGAEDRFTAAGDAPAVLPRVHTGLGMIRLAQGRRTEATELFRKAIDSGDAEILPQARRYLASALLLEGDRDEARTLLEAVAATVGSEHRPGALLLLGQLASLAGSAVAARSWFDQAMAAGDPEVAAEARSELADLPATTAPAPLEDLPARILSLLATVAEAEAKPAEAAYWHNRAAAPHSR